MEVTTLQNLANSGKKQHPTDHLIAVVPVVTLPMKTSSLCCLLSMKMIIHLKSPCGEPIHQHLSLFNLRHVTLDLHLAAQ